MMRYGDGAGTRRMMLIADEDGAVRRGEATARQNAIDIVRQMTIAEALRTMEDAPAADLILVEAGATQLGDADFDALLDRIAAMAAQGLPAIVAIVPELIDQTMARLPSGAVAILCNAGPAERAAEVQLLLARGQGGVRQDAADGAERLRAIGDDLGRIARVLIDMAADGGPAIAGSRPGVRSAEGPAVAVTAAEYRRMLRNRRLRDQYLGEGLFADPAWDILLDLAAARLEGESVAVSSLCIAAAVPPTTALRWIRLLTERGILLRTPDPADGRRVFMTLTPAAADAMAAYAAAIAGGDA